MDGKGHRVIGILGGMGPEATIWLMRRIMNFTPADDDDDHVPLLVDNNTQVPSRIKAIIEGDGEDPLPVLRNMAQKLEACGAHALVMPCNTAHFNASAIAQSVDIPLLNMLDLTASQASSIRAPAGRPMRRIGMLASPAVRMTGGFDRAFEKVSIEVIYSDDTHSTLECIKAIKAGRNDQHTVAALDDVIGELEAKGAEAVVIACSELSLLADRLTTTLPVIDSIDVLARAAVYFSKNPAAS